jgi:hypothetical protein
MKTVATFPRAIFFLTVAATLSSLILLSLVRLPTGDLEDEMDDLEGHVIREDTLVSAPMDGNDAPTDRTAKLHLPAIVVTETSP